MTERDLFICHASQDATLVRRVVEHLEQQGITCWIAGRDIPPRAIYAEAITDAMKNSQACGVIVSRAANASDPVKRELELASRFKRPFIPIRVEDVEPGPGLDYYLNNVQWVEYKRDGDAALDRIVAHMKGQSYVPPPKQAQRGFRAVALGAVALAVAGCIAFLFWPRTAPLPSPPVSSSTTTDTREASTVPNVSLSPTYGTIALSTGFEHDPASISLQSGGSIDASTLNSQAHSGDCVGYVAEPPDVRLNYTAGDQLPLILSANSSSDTTLVVNGPDGRWYCNDDRSSGNINPAMRFPHPSSGQYDIWVGTVGNTTAHDATLYISEVSSP